MAIGTVKRATAVEIRARSVQPGLARYMDTWDVCKVVAVMTGRRSVTVDAVQVMTDIAYLSIRFKLIMGSSPMIPVGRCFAA